MVRCVYRMCMRVPVSVRAHLMVLEKLNVPAHVVDQARL